MPSVFSDDKVGDGRVLSGRKRHQVVHRQQGGVFFILKIALIAFIIIVLLWVIIAQTVPLLFPYDFYSFRLF